MTGVTGVTGDINTEFVLPVPSLSDTTVCASGEIPLTDLYDQVLGPYPGSLTMLQVIISPRSTSGGFRESRSF